MILYFTGTNNSKYVADYLGDLLEDEVISLKAMMKEMKYTFHSEKTYVIAAPIYCYRYPVLVENYLKECNFLGSQKVYCIATMESQTGMAGSFLKKIFEAKQMEFMGFTGIPMPNNYPVTKAMVSLDEAKYIIRHSHEAIEKTADNIRNNQTIHRMDRSPFPWICSTLINPLFVKYQLKLNVNSSCIRCKKCIRECPTENITLFDDEITFGKNCIQCMSCLQNCPMQAINIKNSTQNKGRYICPDYPLENSRL